MRTFYLFRRQPHILTMLFWPLRTSLCGSRLYRILLISAILTSLLDPSRLSAQEIPAIAAAANIKFALDSIASQFTQDTGLQVRVSYGSSGNFVSQIQHGAPFELFLSADERYIQQLVSAGLTRDAGQTYALGRLALVAPNTSALLLDEQLTGVTQLLASGQLERFAIANPDHAPYGERAREVLQYFGLWDALKGKLILGENVSQAAQFAVSGSTQGGIVALSLVSAPQFNHLGRYIALPETGHSPLIQSMVLLPNASSTAQTFYHYLTSDKARQIFTQFGFGLPVQ